MIETAAAKAESYDATKDRNISVERDVFYDGKRDNLFNKGHSKRLWGELYKVLDSSDVVIQVLDARDPQGTREGFVFFFFFFLFYLVCPIILLR